MKLSVIVVNYNVEYFLEQCLLSVQQAIRGIEAEVWVVDNNSVDGSVAMLRQRFPWVKLIESKENLGFSRGNNLAIRQSTGEYVLLLNPDTVVEEDTFSKVLSFMDAHPEAGGLGVKMIDGKGAFLPESKRGLPTPSVAFYKIFGLSALFPKSRKFGRYHLGYLDNNEIHEVEVLSGAFMLMRRSALDKTGLLDEDFFMYGEDIDLSYRLVQAGYKNYYFPKTRIIHYKGESTKKSSINYVFVFYRAMVIFARKHYSEKNVKMFSLFINLAIYLRASLAIINRFIQRAAIPAIDLLAIMGAMFLIKSWHQQVSHIDLSANLINVALPFYSCILVAALYLASGYEKPVKWLNLVKGILGGSVVILVGYSLLPETLRFSRTLTLIGSLSALPVVFLLRAIYQLIGWPRNLFSGINQIRLAIVGRSDECTRVADLMQHTSGAIDFIAPVRPAGSEVSQDYLGSVDQLKEIVEVHNINNVIFCARDISAQDIISNMASLNQSEIEFKIAPPESLYIIGSNSIQGAGELYVFSINSIARNANRRNKRLFDVSFSGLLLIALPLTLIIVQNRMGVIRNIFGVLMGKFSWVGFYPNQDQKLPPVKSGILHPGDMLPVSDQKAETFMKLNVVYAKDYHVRTDLKLVIGCKKLLGRKPLVL